jgi:hypothetical protein
METTVIGIDCAVDERKIGIAVAEVSTVNCRVYSAETGTRQPSIVTRIVEALSMSERALLALDAPLGWPSALGPTLSEHRAGRPLEHSPESLFRRDTDRNIRTRFAKQPLDVGADRIARTAYAALEMLQQLARHIGREIPLAWTPEFKQRVAAVEVYPAGTLLAYGLPASGYKKQNQRAVRKEILHGIREHVELVVNGSVPKANADALDALVCVLAGFDFLLGMAVGPDDLDLARKEGWIWVRSVQ